MNIIRLSNGIKNNEIKNKKKFVPIDENDNLKLFFTMLLLAPRGFGKTNSAINILKYMQENNLVNDYGTYIITTTFDNNNFESYLKLYNENVFTNINNTEDLNIALKIIDKEISDKVKKWKITREEYTLKEYEKRYKDIYKKYLCYEMMKRDPNIDYSELCEYELDEEEINYIMDNNYEPKQTYYYIIPSYVLLLDDIQGLFSNNRNDPLNNMLIRHRHKHLSIIILNQYLKNFPKILRANIMYWGIQHFKDKKIFDDIYEEIDNSCFKTYDDFIDTYNYCTQNPHDFLFIDFMENKKRIRKNFNEIII